MEDIERKKLYGRAELKKYFRNGSMPNEIHFGHLIDSIIVQHDDGISKDEDNGYIISPLGSSKKIMTIYENMDRLEPYFFVEKDGKASPSLKFIAGDPVANEEEQDNKSTYFHKNGNLGLGVRSHEKLKLQVNGLLGTQGRVGTYKMGMVPADGKWHKIIEGLDNCQAFEIMARTGRKGSGKFSIMHAIAVSAFGRSRNKIRKTRSWFGFFWNRLNLRWTGTTHNFSLELKSNRNFGKGVNIYFNVSKLWDDEAFLDEDAIYSNPQ